MRVRFKGQVPKDAGYPDCNEDVVAVEEAVGRVAVADGASESFDSRAWAHLLAVRFVRRPPSGESWIAEAADEYAEGIDPSALSWSQEAAFERGSFATLLGVQFHPGRNALEVFGVGDSLAALVQDGRLVRTFPYRRSEEFRQRPTLFSTNRLFNSFLEEPGGLDSCREVWEIEDLEEPIVLLLTDALAEWALRCEEEGEPQWQRLSALESQSDLETLVVNCRVLGAMRTDDCTLVCVDCGEVEADGLPDA